MTKSDQQLHDLLHRTRTSALAALDKYIGPRMQERLEQITAAIRTGQIPAPDADSGQQKTEPCDRTPS